MSDNDNEAPDYRRPHTQSSDITSPEWDKARRTIIPHNAKLAVNDDQEPIVAVGPNQDLRLLVNQNLELLNELTAAIPKDKEREIVKAYVARLWDDRDKEIEPGFTNINRALDRSDVAAIKQDVAALFGLTPRYVAGIFKKHHAALASGLLMAKVDFKDWKEPASWGKTLGERLELPVGLDFYLRYVSPSPGIGHVNIYQPGQLAICVNKPNAIDRALVKLASCGHAGKTFLAVNEKGDTIKSGTIPNTLLQRTLAPRGWDVSPIDTVFETRKNPWRRWLIGGKEAMAVYAEWPNPLEPHYTEPDFEALQYAMILWCMTAYRQDDGTLDTCDFRPVMLLAEPLRWDFMEPIRVRAITHFDGPRVHERQFEPDDVSQACQKVQAEMMSQIEKKLTAAE